MGKNPDATLFAELRQTRSNAKIGTKKSGFIEQQFQEGFGWSICWSYPESASPFRV
jgi:hypothetical protein